MISAHFSRTAALPPARRRRWLLSIVAGSLLAGYGSITPANPLAPTVISGQVDMLRQGSELTITNSPNAIIHWDSFSIAPGELTRFVQQSSSSSVLNRITGQDPSQILGTLQSNGRVFLLNPNGILFGAGAQVEVGGLVASTLAITNQDFIAGRQRFNAGPVAGAVNNLGRITTPSGGQVALIAPMVGNSGLITTPRGEVMLAAGRSVQLADTTNPNLHVVLSADSDEAVNVGQVVAAGGRINIFGALIQQRGRLSADSVVAGEDGRILLKSRRMTVLETGSVVSATGTGSGGDIQILGRQVALAGNARVDASGDQRGGSVLIGGSYRRSDPRVMNADQAWVDCDATVAADARIAGNGGRIVVWGERTAQVYGLLSARGGSQSGDGGMIETSGRWLDTAGMRIDASASRGRAGSWLLDPYDINITNDSPPLSPGIVGIIDPNSSGGTTTIAASTISAASADVILEATHDINFSGEVNIGAQGVALTARAGNDINVYAPISTNGGDITLAANYTGSTFSSSGTGVVNRFAPLDAGGGSANVRGGGGSILANGEAVILASAPSNLLFGVPGSLGNVVIPAPFAPPPATTTNSSGSTASESTESSNSNNTVATVTNQPKAAANDRPRKTYCN